jgi:putative ABC transport system permease protein
MTTLRQDIVYAWRVLSRKPGFTVITALTLALGIAANTTMFSLISGVLLRPLPFPDSQLLVRLWTSYPVASNGEPDVFSPGNWVDVAARAKALEAVGAYTTSNFTVTRTTRPESVEGLRMSASMARVLAVSPRLGRWFTDLEDNGSAAVVVIGDRFWRSRFNADANVLGRTVIINSRACVVIGVLPPGIGFPTLTTDLYAPISFTPEEKASRASIFLDVAARLGPGMLLEKARAELHAIAAGLAKSYPEDDKGIDMGAIPLQRDIVGDIRSVLLVLWAAVAFMLAVGCANVANLLLTHATGRRREFAVRRALGATDLRLARQLVTESLVLAAVAGAIGLTAAVWAVPFMASHLPASVPRFRNIAVDGGVLWFTAGISILTGILFGLAPALNFASGNLGQAMREGGDRGGTAHRRFGRALMAGEVAIIFVLLIGAGLVVQTLVKLSRVDPGFQAHNVAAWQIFLPAERYKTAAERVSFYREALDRVRAVPGVESAALVMPLPFGPVDVTLDMSFAIVGRPELSPERWPVANITHASAAYFETLGIPLRAGRYFSSADTATSAPVVVISEALARRHFAGQNPLGQHIVASKRGPAFEIVGVVGDVHHNNVRSASRPEVYLPLERAPASGAGIVVRASGNPAALLRAVQQRVWTLDPDLAANLAAPVEQILYDSLAPARLAAILLGGFATITLVLGLIGIYGVLSYGVAQRTREIGIRIALGATRQEVLGMVLVEAAGVALAGAALGACAAAALSRYLKTLLFGVSALDPKTYAIVAIALVTAALAAAFAPARRATLVDPAISLRAD